MTSIGRGLTPRTISMWKGDMNIYICVFLHKSSRREELMVKHIVLYNFMSVIMELVNFGYCRFAMNNWCQQCLFSANVEERGICHILNCNTKGKHTKRSTLCIERSIRCLRMRATMCMTVQLFAWNPCPFKSTPFTFALRISTGNRYASMLRDNSYMLLIMIFFKYVQN